MLLQVTVLNFNVPGVIFDLGPFNFHVPICGSAATQTDPASTHHAKVNPIVRIFMRSIESGFSVFVNTFPG
jgi:hypothetical protein